MNYSCRKHSHNSPLDNVIKVESIEKSSNFEVAIDKEGKYKVENLELERDSLESKLVFMKQNGKQEIIIRSNQEVQTKHIIYIMDIANRNNIKSILVFKPQPK